MLHSSIVNSLGNFATRAFSLMFPDGYSIYEIRTTLCTRMNVARTSANQLYSKAMTLAGICHRVSLWFRTLCSSLIAKRNNRHRPDLLLSYRRWQEHQMMYGLPAVCA